MKKEKVVNIDTKLGSDILDNLDQLRLDQNFDEIINAQKVITTIPCKRPNKQDWIRVHPDESFSLQTAILEVSQDREHYMVVKELWHLWPNEIVPKMLYTAINRQNVLSIWPIRLPDETGRLDKWNESAHKAAQIAMKQWVRVVSNRSGGYYDVLTPQGELESPKFPDISFREILKIAFEDRIIDSEDHPVIKNLFGVV